MHAKTIVIDKEVLLTGSVNMTGYGLDYNKEHMFRITGHPEVIEQVYRDFEQTWAKADVVGEKQIEIMMMNARDEGKKKKSKSRSGSASRSMSSELDDAGEVADEPSAHPMFHGGSSSS